MFRPTSACTVFSAVVAWALRLFQFAFVLKCVSAAVRICAAVFVPAFTVVFTAPWKLVLRVLASMIGWVLVAGPEKTNRPAT